MWYSLVEDGFTRLMQFYAPEPLMVLITHNTAKKPVQNTTIYQPNKSNINAIKDMFNFLSKDKMHSAVLIGDCAIYPQI